MLQAAATALVVHIVIYSSYKRCYTPSLLVLGEPESISISILVLTLVCDWKQGKYTIHFMQVIRDNMVHRKLSALETFKILLSYLVITMVIV